MTFEEIIYDVREIAALLEDDVDIQDLWILQKINSYRSILIREQYMLEPIIDPSWLQPVEKFDFTKVNATDDPAITYASITLGRAILPAVVSLPDDLGMYRLTGSGGIVPFEPTDIDTLIMKAMVKESIHRNFGYYARIGLFAYVYPFIMEGKAIIIAENPMNVKIHDGSSFRTTTFEDPYPLDARLAQAAIMEVLTKDLNLNARAITDVVNDAQSQLKVLKDAPNIPYSKE